jgi:uncharacterized membrane protein
MILLVWIHLVAAVVWIGGMAFLSLVLMPPLTREPLAAHRAVLIQIVSRRFRVLVWVSIAVLLVSGMMLLSGRVPSLLVPEGWPLLAQVKVGLVLVLILLTALHDFWLGPLVSRLLHDVPTTRTATARWLIRLSPWIARAGLVLGLAVLLAAVALVRR